VSSSTPRRAPALPIVTAFIIGGVWGHSASIGTSLLVILLALLAATELARRGKTSAATLLVLCGFFFLGAVSRRGARQRVEHQSLLELYEALRLGALESPTLVEGRLIREPEPGDDASVLMLMAEQIVVRGRPWACRGGIRASVRGAHRFRSELDRFHPDDSIRLWVVLRRPRSFGNPGRFDLEAYMDRLGVTLTGSVKSALLVERVEPGSFWKSVLSRVRRYARKQITGACRRIGVEKSEIPGVVLALVVGDRFLIPPWAEQLYQEAGTFHVIAISGAHVGLVALLLYGGLRRWGLDQNPALLTLMICLPAYAALTGGRPSVVRAVLMSSSVVGAKLLSLDAPGMNGLALSALLLLVFRPLDLYDPGFQLSFVGTAAILMFYEPLARGLKPKLGKLGSWVAISLAAQIGVLPILAWHFGRITPAAVFANLLVMPLAGALIVTGALLVIIAPLPWLGEGVAWVTWLFVKGMTVSSQLAVTLPGARSEFRAREPCGQPSTLLPWPSSFSVEAGGGGPCRSSHSCSCFGSCCCPLPPRPLPCCGSPRSMWSAAMPSYWSYRGERGCWSMVEVPSRLRLISGKVSSSPLCSGVVFDRSTLSS
jgi:competence protein ComEC